MKKNKTVESRESRVEEQTAPLQLPALPSLDKQEVTHVHVSNVTASPFQPRKEFPAEEMEQLRESIRANGIRIPLLGRPNGKPGTIELVAGERRFRSAQALELPTVPMIIQDLTDDEVIRIQRLENGARENLKALEAAEDYLLLEKQGKTVEEICTLHGVKRSHVFTRKRVARLPEDIKQLVRDGKLAITIADLVAKLPTPELQADLAKHATTPDWEKEMPSFREVQEIIEEDYTRKLSQAGWKYDENFVVPVGDAKQYKAGTAAMQTLEPCTTCPKRSGNIPGSEGSPHLCTDVKCYERKQAAHATRILAEAKAKGQNIVPPASYQARSYTFEETTSKPYQDDKKRTMAVLAKAAGIEPSVTVNRAGQAIQVFTPEDKNKIFAHHKFPGYDAKERAKHKQQEDNHRTAQKLRQQVLEILLPQLRPKVEKLAVTESGQLKLLTWLFAELDENFYNTETTEKVGKQKLPQAWGLGALLICEEHASQVYQDYPTCVSQLCDLVGVDLKAEEKKLKTATSQSKPAVKTTTKKGNKK